MHEYEIACTILGLITQIEQLQGGCPSLIACTERVTSLKAWASTLKDSYDSLGAQPYVIDSTSGADDEMEGH